MRPAGTLSKIALFRSLGYEPHAGQLLVHQSKAPRRVVVCGVRWGKSMCGAYEAIAAALQPCESSIGWIVGPTFDLADRTFRLVQRTVLQHMKHRVIKMQERERWFTLYNIAGGVSEVGAKSADHPVSLLGEGLDWLVLDEAARVPQETWESCLATRLVDKSGWALLLSTPQGLGWFHRAYRLGQKERDPTFESWRAPSWQNPHLPKGAIDVERGRLSKESFAQEFEAQFIGGEVEVCDTCGCPSASVPGVIVVRGEAPLPCCPECGRYVNAEGQTIVKQWPDGQLHLKVIRLEDLAPTVGELAPLHV